MTAKTAETAGGSAGFPSQVQVKFLRGFGLATKAAAGVAKIRQLVLSLAIRGQLVPSDTNDEPAQVILDRIREMRKTNRGRVPSVASPTEDQRRFDVPSGWCWTRLDQVADSRLGKMLDKAKNTGALRPYLRNTNVQWHRFVLEDIKEIRLEQDELEEFCLIEGDLLICEGGEPGRCAIWRNLGTEMYFQKALHRVRPLGGVLPEFIELCLTHDASSGDLEGYFTGATIKHFAGQELNRYAIPLPPLAEQHRIVARVEELMKLCDALEENGRLADEQHARLTSTLFDALAGSESANALAENWKRVEAHFDLLLDRPEAIDALESAVLALAVRGRLVPQDPSEEGTAVVPQGKTKGEPRPIAEGEIPFELPTNWRWVRLGQVATLINGDRGKNYPHRSEYVPAGLPFINTGHIEPDGTLAHDSMHFLTRAKFDSLRSGKTVRGDLVYCLRGATLGKTAIVTYPEGAIASSLAIIRLNEEVNRKYIYYYLISPLGKALIRRFDNGSAQPNLAANSVTRYVLPLPPPAEQRRIVARVEELRSLCADLRGKLTRTQGTQNALADALVATV